MPLVLEGAEAMKIDEGRHTGRITRIEERTDPYHYIDIYIETKTPKGSTELKYGAPMPKDGKLRPTTKLGKLVETIANVKISPKQKYDIEKLLVGREVSFMTVNEETDRGTFARIVDGSLKPIK
ncbi:MAG: hypothetical protein DRN12_05255 [Thermoplasmata archaeon]|nr:MAG: hypothetical protein DRN12_05255 [Thermoplasmata archaeon]